MDADDTRQALDALEALGVVVDERWTIHEKVVLVDDEIVWFGSLNPLSHTSRTDEVMVRTVSRNMALQLVSFLSTNIGRMSEAAEGAGVEKENPTCPKGAARTCYVRGRHGPFFRCERCDWKCGQDALGRADTTEGYDVLQRAPRCPKCGSSMVLRHGRWGPFFGCKSYPTCRGTVRIENTRRRRRSRGARG